MFPSRTGNNFKQAVRDAPLVIAHRGARSIAPENTIPAALKAYEAGADLWETDVRMTRDRHLILFHDDTLDRTTDVRTRFPGASGYRVDDFTLDEITTLDAGSYFVSTDPFAQIRAGNVSRQECREFVGVRVPTLAQGLEFTGRHAWAVNLELKHHFGENPSMDMPELVIDAIIRSGIDPAKVAVSSFFHPWLHHIRSRAPEIEVQALIDTPADIARIRSGGSGSEDFDVYNVAYPLVTRALVSDLALSGKKINVYTVNNPDVVSKLTRYKVAGIITDFPQYFSRMPI